MNPIRPRRRRPAFLSPRVILDLFMALLMLFFGYFIMYSHTLLGYDYFADSEFLKGSVRWLMAGLFAVYGLFRLYRAYVLFENEKLKSDDNEY